MLEIKGRMQPFSAGLLADILHVEDGIIYLIGRQGSRLPMNIGCRVKVDQTQLETTYYRVAIESNWGPLPAQLRM